MHFPTKWKIAIDKPVSRIPGIHGPKQELDMFHHDQVRHKNGNLSSLYQGLNVNYVHIKHLLIELKLL
jgi:hypothetical protein